MPFQDYALVVGIDHYPGLTPLGGAERDARDFYAWVTSAAGGNVATENVTLLVSSDFPAAIHAEDALPVARHVEDFFTKIDNASEANNEAGLGLKAGKRVWLFFSGHGFAASLDRSAVMMANATVRRTHSVAAVLWANRLHEGGWFDDVFLFQDACRSSMSDVELTPPFLRRRSAPLAQVRRRFYAFSAKNGQISKELAIGGASMRGIFAFTLMKALNGEARDPRTGALNTAQLKAYLQSNMAKLLSAVDLHDNEIAKMPEVLDPDPFEILPPIPDAVAKFPVEFSVSVPGRPASILASDLTHVETVEASPPLWSRELARGLYKFVVEDLGYRLFEVTGAVATDGTREVVYVAI